MFKVASSAKRAAKIEFFKLIYNHLIKEQEAAHCATIGVITDITCLTITDGMELLEEKLLSRGRNIIPNSLY